MGRRGPPKKPTELKLLQGIPGGEHKLNKNEPRPEKLGDLTPPELLTEEGKEIWRSVAEYLHRLNLLTEIDTLSLLVFCDVVEKWRKAKRFLDESGSTYEIFHEQTPEEVAAKVPKKLKYCAQYPQVSIYNQLTKDIIRIGNQFGLTPAARASLNLDKGAGNQGKSNVKSRLYG